MKLIVVMLFFKGAELVWGKMPGAAIDEKGCMEIAAQWIEQHLEEVNLALADGATPKMYCIPIPDTAVKS
jgi:hypothetical protein